jgi:hypothetical protein
MRFISIIKNNALGISVGLYLFSASLALGNTYYVDYKYPRDEPVFLYFSTEKAFAHSNV